MGPPGGLASRRPRPQVQRPTSTRFRWVLEKRSTGARRLRSFPGETIRIVNEDDRGHNVGPWFVGANETLNQEFSSAGEFEGVCTVHPSGQLILIVTEAEV
jgi:hypothetical protein